MANDWDNIDEQELENNIAKYEEAERKGESIYMDSDELTGIAEHYYNSGNMAKAIQVLEYAIELFPHSIMPLVFRARIAMLDGKDISLAKRLAKEVGDKTDFEYLYLEAEIRIVEGKPDEADKYLSKYLDMLLEEDKPDFILDSAMLFADYGQFDIAEKWLQLSDEKDIADYKEVKGRIAAARGNYTESEHIFENLLDEDPFSNHLWNSLASNQMMQNKMNDAIASSEFSIAINPKDEEAIINKANSLFCLACFNEALEYYKRYTELRPDNYYGYMCQGNTLLNLDRPEEALALYKKAEKLLKKDDDDIVEVYQEIAFTLSALGKPSEALRYARKAELCKNADKEEINILKGHIYLGEGDAENAMQYFEAAIKDAKSKNKVYLHVAISMYDCCCYEPASNLFRSVINSKVNKDNEGYAYLASCYKNLGREKDFLKYLKKACELNPKEVRLIFGQYIPRDLEEKDYYNYLSKKR